MPYASFSLNKYTVDFLLKNIAYQRAQIAITESLGWPFLMPWPKYAVKKILRKVGDAGKDEDGDGILDDIFAADTDTESDSDPDESESDDEHSEEKRCMRHCCKKKGNTKKAAWSKPNKKGSNTKAKQSPTKKKKPALGKKWAL